MKNMRFWITRFVSVAAAAFALLAGLYLLRGMPAGEALREAGIWSVLAAAIFTGNRYWKARQGKSCALCRDTVE